MTVVSQHELHGDNVAGRSAHMPWYCGPALLAHLETVPLTARAASAPFRMPVQYKIRPHQDYRGLAGRIAAGAVRIGDEVVVMPRGTRSRVAAMDTAEPEHEEPDRPALRLDTTRFPIDQLAARVIAVLQTAGVLPHEVQP